MGRSKDEIAYTQVFEGPDYYIRVNHPKLTPEEYERRHKQIHDAAARILIAQQKARKLKEETDKGPQNGPDKE